MPATHFGKAISSHNSLKHGLSPGGSLLPPDFEAELPRRLAPWAEAYAQLLQRHPEAPALIRDLALAQLRIERCQASEHAALSLGANPAAAAAQLELDAQRLLDRLPQHPARFLKQLRLSPAGCNLLLRAWLALDLKAQSPFPWTDDDRRQALDLLGLENNERLVHPDALVLGLAQFHLDNPDTPDDTRTTALSSIRTLIARQTAALKDHLRFLLQQAENQRDLANLGYDLNPTPEILRLRRYEQANRRIYTRALQRLETLALAPSLATAATEAESRTSPNPETAPPAAVAAPPATSSPAAPASKPPAQPSPSAGTTTPTPKSPPTPTSFGQHAPAREPAPPAPARNRTDHPAQTVLDLDGKASPAPVPVGAA